MNNKLIEVKTYSGRRALEYPLQIKYPDHWIDVKVIAEQIEEDLVSRCRKRVFLVEDLRGNRYLLYYDMGLELWFLVE